MYGIHRYFVVDNEHDIAPDICTLRHHFHFLSSLLLMPLSIKVSTVSLPKLCGAKRNMYVLFSTLAFFHIILILVSARAHTPALMNIHILP